MTRFLSVDGPKDDALLPAYQNTVNTSKLFEYYGFQCDLSDRRAPILNLPVIHLHHRGGIGSDAVNGGIISCMCDFALGMVGILNLPAGPKGSADLKINFIRPLFGNTVRATTEILRQRSRMVAVRINVLNEKNVCCTQAEGRLTMMLTTDDLSRDIAESVA